MRVSYSVMAHPAREARARALGDLLGCPVVWDRGLGEDDTAARAWAVAGGSDWHVVLQDDAVAVEGFAEHAAAMLAEADGSVVSLYVGTGYPQFIQAGVASAVRRADEVGARWLTAHALFWGVAVAIPTARVGDWLAYRSEGWPYDRRIGVWARERGLTIKYTWPSLVGHADEPALLDHGDGVERVLPRRAWRVGVPASGSAASRVVRF